MIRRVAGTVLESILAPLAVYGLLVLAGVPIVWALLGSAGVSVVVVGARYLRSGRINALGLLVGAHFLLGIAVAAITGDARLMLAREAAGTTLTALFFAATVAAGVPMIARIHRDFVDHATFDARWDRDPAFRSDHRRLTVVWSSGLLATAGGIVLAAYLPPLEVAVVLTQVLPVPVYLGLIGWTQRRFARTAPELHAQGTSRS